MFWSIMSMYDYDPTLFDGLTLPQYEAPDETILSPAKQDVINAICLECAELEVIYPSPSVIKQAIETWSNSLQNSWNKLWATEVIEYNPIWNVDADESETHTHGITRNRTGSDNETRNLSDKRSVKGYNETDHWTDAEKMDRTGTDNIAHSDNETVTENNSIIKRRTGNIGVTASQDLIQKERDIADFNIVDHIAKQFKQRFCLLVY